MLPETLCTIRFKQETMRQHMLELLIATAVCGLGMRTIQGVFVTVGGRPALPRLDIGSVRIWILVSLAVILVFKIKYGSALLLALMLHELGHVAAHRILGHQEIRFRLVPLLKEVPISNKPIRSQAEAFFVTIMGAGFSLVPMVAALVAANVLKDMAPAAASVLFAIGSTVAALNFVNLLPLLPLDGGRCLRQIFNTLCPVTGGAILLTISAAAASLSFAKESLGLLVIVCVGGVVFFRPLEDENQRPPMLSKTAFLALAIYLFTFAAHAVAGWWLIRWYFW
jgi:Zn-dependent protease